MSRMQCFFSLLALLLAGCGKMTTVEGTVLLDGKPLAGVSPIFASVNHRWTAYAGEEARFELDLQNGFQSGEYRVAIYDPAYSRTFSAPLGSLPGRAPWRYCRVETTPLTVSLEQGPNDLTLDLTSDP